jgi:hypothetical protein
MIPTQSRASLDLQICGLQAAQLGKSEPVQASADPLVRPASSGEPAPKLPPIKIRFKLPPKKDAGTETKKDAGPDTKKDAGSGMMPLGCPHLRFQHVL